MKDIIKSVLTFVGPAFALLLLGFTGIQTFTLILAVTGSPIIAAVGLILFEGGMLYWWFVFRSEAEGLPQMALSLMVFVACLVFVVMATALKLGAVDGSVLGASTPAKIITAAAVVQLAAKMIFPLLHPEVSHEIKNRSQEGKIIAASDKKFEAKVDGIADTYADARADVQVAKLLTSLNKKHGTQYQYQLPAPAPVVIEGQSDEAPAPRLSFVDRLRGRRPPVEPPQPPATVDQAALMAAIAEMVQRGELVVPVGNSTHDAARHDGKPNGAPPPAVGGAGGRRSPDGAPDF